MDNKLIIIVPCFNEEAVIDDSLKKLASLLNNMILDKIISDKSQICVVNDGSKDKTQEIIDEYTSKNKQIACIKLTRNFGHQAAIMAGISIIEASSIITIDADLQDDYMVIPKMIEKYNEGFDIVYGIRNDRSSDFFIKKFTAELFYTFMNFIGVNLIYNHADFRLLSFNAVEKLKQFKEKNLFLRGLIPLIGLKSSNVYYERKQRKAGKSKYSLCKMISFAINGIVSFSIVPLRLISLTGLILFIISFFMLIYFFLYNKFNFFFFSLILFTNSLIIISIGILGEYINQIRLETKNRPLYFIESIVNLD